MTQLTLYPLLVRMYLRRLSEYRADLFLGAIPLAAAAALGVIFLHVVLSTVHSPQGWTPHEATIVYGLATISIAAARILFKETMSVISLVRSGDLAQILITPINPLLMLISGSLGLEYGGQAVLGIALVIYGIRGAAVPLTPHNLAIAAITVISGAVIVASLDLMASSLALYSEGSLVLMNVTRTIIDFGRYPASLFGRALSFALTAVIPIAFGGYLAGAYLTGHSTTPFAYLSPVVAGVLAFAAYSVWANGLRRFQGTGS